MSTAELRAAWVEHMGRATPPVQRRLLIRELAWRSQERQHGGLDPKTRRLLNAAMRSANSVSDAGQFDRMSEFTSGQELKRASPMQGSLPALLANTRFVRTWRGVRHEVVVVEGGTFRYRERTYDSLSEIARAITGVRWSGPRFFGLRSRGGGRAR
jgi:hypothetical protein